MTADPATDSSASTATPEPAPDNKTPLSAGRRDPRPDRPGRHPLRLQPRLPGGGAATTDRRQMARPPARPGYRQHPVRKREQRRLHKLPSALRRTRITVQRDQPRLVACPVGAPASARVTASGSRAMTRNRMRTGPVGTRRRFSYCLMVATENPKRFAKASCDRPSRMRNARTSSTSSGVTRRPAARISSVFMTGAVSVSSAAWRAMVSSSVASNRRQSIWDRSSSRRECGAVGMALTLIGFA